MLINTPLLSSSAAFVLFIWLEWFLRWEVSDHTVAVLWGVDNRICSRQRAAFLCSSHQAFSLCLDSKHVVHPYNSIDKGTARKKSHFILLDRSDLQIINNLSIAAAHTFNWYILTLLSVDEMLLPTYVNLSINFRGLPFKVEVAPPYLKHVLFHLHSHRGQLLQAKQ